MKILDVESVDEIHDEILSYSGGLQGKSLDRPIESVLHRVYNHMLYGGSVDIYQAAALYAYSIAEGHPYLDGNKRTAMTSMLVFLELNGKSFGASDFQLVEKMVQIADGSISLKRFTVWVRQNII